MKKFVFVLTFLLLFTYSCKENKGNKPKVKIIDPKFITLNGKYFEVNNESFFPIMLNYIVHFRNIDNKCVIAPYMQYENIEKFETNTETENYEQLRGHFHLVREMGFNSMRIVLFFLGNDGDEQNPRYNYAGFSIDTEYEKIFSGLDKMVKIAEEENLKLIILLKPPFDNSKENFTINLLEHFKDNPTIFAYDFFNEPLYYDEARNGGKKEIIEVVSNWKKMMEEHAPNQMLTIGLAEPIEVFEWDPAMLPIDFLAFHTYHPLRVKSEIYWYSKYTNKPWIIGEIGLPSDNDSIPYSDQAIFAKEIFQYSVECGAAGFGWWDFQDKIGEQHYENNYVSLLNHDDITTTSDGKYKIIGTMKPAVLEIQKFAEYLPKYSKIKNSERPVNYFNMVGYNNFVLKGQIVDSITNKPIEGAVIRGWNESWKVGMNTYSDENGNFTLYSNDKNYHFEFSAPYKTKVRFDKRYDYKNTTNINYDIDNLPAMDLEYQKIGHYSSLKVSAHSVFDFEPTKFNQAKFEADMGIIYLQDI
ncbi:MAG: carboxypeptidase-like regulatory domain-containing protein [Bacteroidales bacterium]|jgi:hypothetical protein|nr:carboxypeptidase-like regulatory domain-containing protein [Bacteroidales bacterium]